jgi:hypothetical protein
VGLSFVLPEQQRLENLGVISRVVSCLGRQNELVFEFRAPISVRSGAAIILKRRIADVMVTRNTNYTEILIEELRDIGFYTAFSTNFQIFRLQAEGKVLLIRDMREGYTVQINLDHVHSL